MYNKKVLLFSFMTLVCHFTTTAKRAGADNLNYYVDPSVESFPIESISQSSSLQFITHGKPGFLYINGKWCDAVAIATFIKKHHLLLQSSTNVNIYGCSFGDGQEGANAVAYLKKTLGVDVAASDNVTGHGGDWVLETGKAKNVLNLPEYQYNLQTICYTVPSTYVNSGWSTVPASPSYTPPAGCNGSNTGITTTNDVPLDHGFGTAYDSPNFYLWSRTLSGLVATETYHVRIELASQNNGSDMRNGYFPNYNLAGVTGSFTAPGGSSNSPAVYYDFDVTNKTSLSFSGSIGAAPYNNCDQAQNFNLILRVSLIGDTVYTYSPPVQNVTTTTNICPDTGSNLTGLATGCSGSGVTLEWHTTDTNYSASTKVANITSVPDGTYYAICHKAAGDCYSYPSPGVTVVNTVCSGNPAPVDFVSVNALWKQNDAIVNWTVAHETQNNFFTIERSFDGAYFEAIGKVKSVGDHEAPISYSYVDAGVKNKTVGMILYRIRQVDINEQNTISKVVTLYRSDNGSGAAYIYPNPGKNGSINFVYQNASENDGIVLDIRIMSADGRCVYTTAAKVGKGTNNLPIETRNLAKGIYYLGYTNASLNISGNMKMIVE